MKKIDKILKIILFCLSTSFIFAQSDGVPTQAELGITNQVGYTIYVRLYPVSMMFNGLYGSIGNDYNLESTRPQSPPSSGNQGYWWDYINGVSVYRSTNGGDEVRTYYTLANGQTIYFNHDLGATGTNGCFGYGLWKVEIASTTNFIDSDSVLFEQDYSAIGDNSINYIWNNNKPEIHFTLQEYQENPIVVNYDNEDNYIIRAWKRFGRPKNYGNFNYDSQSPYSIMPLDCRRDCNIIISHPNQNHYFPADWTTPWFLYNDVRQGDLTLNLTIDKSTSTPTYNQIYDPNSYKIYTNQMTVIRGTILKLAAGKNLTLEEYPVRKAFTMRVKGRTDMSQTPGVLLLAGNGQPGGICTLRVKRNAFLYLERGSAVRFFGNSKIIVEPYGLICLDGADIRGNGSVEIHGPSIVECSDDNIEHIFQDSTSLLLDDSVTWVIPSDKTITFDGRVTSLKIGLNSEIKFGTNSKLVFQNGARLIADHAKFTSSDPSSIWDGIYLSDLSNDTITNCTIENAVNGINIIDKTNAGGTEQPSTEISNCTFSNTTTTQLTNGIYVNNSEHVLIKGNSFTSSELAQGFANGVMIEYCPAGSPLVVDNNIDKVLTGMFVSQSSPYVARNIITGVSESGKGIELDNANGTFKYNIVSNFVNSLITAYSSPYLLKNTFSGASEKNIDIYCSSIPVMRPINSGTTLSWLSGNNYITGNPSASGIGISEDSYPDIDSGFSIIDVGNSDYMSGEIPTSLDGWLFTTRNYWTDEPSSQRFNVSGGEVIYDPTFDGSSYPPIDYYDLTEIGFGLYDTVYVESLGDNPQADNLFMQAYQSERNHQYLQAIYLYKQVITNYRNSTYAPVSLSRIFNCLEKKISSNNEYQLLQTYMSNLKTNNLYNRQIREIAEDFVIKTKVKLGYLPSAINDYQTMYQQNQNNHKGIHALINKEILTEMLNDSGDTPTGGNSYAKLTNHKLRLLSIITGRDFTPLKVTNNSSIPHEYKLYQNYPNPFNPKTTIKYDLPKDGFVTFKIYDVLGKELYSKTEYKTAGSFQITLDGTNYASGLYFYRLEFRQAGSSTGSFVQIKKMVLIK